VDQQPRQPIIGILSDPPARKHHGYHFLGYDMFYKSLCEHAQASGLRCFITTLKALDDALRTGMSDLAALGMQGTQSKVQVRGYSWSNEQIEKGIFPLPDLLYNRLTRRHVEKSPTFNRVLRYLRLFDVIFLHTTYIDKWQMINVLKKSPASFYLPPTEPYTDASLFNLLQQHGALFIKPALGSLGRDIFYIRYVRENKTKSHFALQKSEHPETVHTFWNQPSLRQWLKKEGPSGSYIMQPDLELVRLDDRPLDFRVHLVREQPDRFRVVSTVARLGPVGQIVTNIARGGKMMPATLALEQLKISYPQWAHALRLKHLQAVAKEIVTAYMRTTDHPDMPLIELGVDLAVSKQGVIYLLEINGKPSKATESSLGNEPRPSTRALVRAFLHFYRAHTIQKEKEG